MTLSGCQPAARQGKLDYSVYSLNLAQMEQV